MYNSRNGALLTNLKELKRLKIRAAEVKNRMFAEGWQNEEVLNV